MSLPARTHLRAPTPLAAAALLALLATACGESGAGGDDAGARPSADAPTADQAADRPGNQAADQTGDQAGDQAADQAPGASAEAEPPRGEADAPDGGPTFAGRTRRIDAVALTFSLPDDWVVRQPDGGFRVIEGRAAGDDPTLAEATFVATHFGPTGAGAHEDNLLRWARQVVDEQGEPVQPSIGQMRSERAPEIVALTFESTGTFMSGMPGEEPTPKAGSTVLAAIVEGGADGPVYLKLTGPARTIDDLRPAWRHVLRTLRPANAGEPASRPAGY